MPEEKLTTSIEYVAEVLQQLKQEVRQQQQLGEAGAFLDVPATAMDRPASLRLVHSTMRVSPHLPIAWPTWPKGLWCKVVALVQKVVRRLLRWYINPIVEQQNRYNAAVAQALDMLWGQVVRMRVQGLQEQCQNGPKGE